jgi:glutathione S-transferase
MHKPLIYQRWPATHPGRIQLYSMNTPNGIKVALALEEMRLAYEPHIVNLRAGDQRTPEFLSINPNGKIPALYDPRGPDDHPISFMESAAILLYLAGKTGEFMPLDAAGKSVCLQWLFFQAGHVVPAFGQFGHYYRLDPEKCNSPYPLQRFTQETRRLLSLLDDHLDRHDYMLGESYSIVDMAICPWVECLSRVYKAEAILGLDEYDAVNDWLELCTGRPAYKIARGVCAVG